MSRTRLIWSAPNGGGEPELGQAWNGIAEGGGGGVVENPNQAALDVLAHHVFPATGLGVYFLPRQPDHVDEEPLGEPVLAHHGDSQAAALVGELEVPVACNVQQAVAFHPGDGLADGGATLVEALGDTRTQRHYALFLEVVDGPQVHLGGIDQIVHFTTLRQG